MTAQHTPGPWWNSGLEVGTVPMMMVKICSHVSGSNFEEAQANARLIAAAPELLELCRRALRALDEDSFPQLRDDLRQGIDQAEGKP